MNTSINMTEGVEKLIQMSGFSINSTEFYDAVSAQERDMIGPPTKWTLPPAELRTSYTEDDAAAHKLAKK